MEWITPLNGLLTDSWFTWAWHNYSMLIGIIALVMSTVLKIIAIVHPDNKTNSILCLLQGLVYGFPGMKKAEIPKEEIKE